MAICPHCHEASIGILPKWWSSPAHPTACTRCGELSYNSKYYATSVSRAAVFIPALAVVVLFASSSLAWALGVGVAGIIGAVAYEAAAFYRAPMVATVEASAEQVRSHERLGLAVVGAIAVCAVVVWWANRAP